MTFRLSDAWLVVAMMVFSTLSGWSIRAQPRPAAPVPLASQAVIEERVASLTMTVTELKADLAICRADATQLHQEVAMFRGIGIGISGVFLILQMFKLFARPKS